MSLRLEDSVLTSRRVAASMPVNVHGNAHGHALEALRSTDVAGPEDFVPDVDPTEQVTGPASDRHIRRSGCP